MAPLRGAQSGLGVGCRVMLNRMVPFIERSKVKEANTGKVNVLYTVYTTFMDV